MITPRAHRHPLNFSSQACKVFVARPTAVVSANATDSTSPGKALASCCSGKSLVFSASKHRVFFMWSIDPAVYSIMPVSLVPCLSSLHPRMCSNLYFWSPQATFEFAAQFPLFPDAPSSFFYYYSAIVHTSSPSPLAASACYSLLFCVDFHKLFFFFLSFSPPRLAVACCMNFSFFVCFFDFFPRLPVLSRCSVRLPRSFGVSSVCFVRSRRRSDVEGHQDVCDGPDSHSSAGETFIVASSSSIDPFNRPCYFFTRSCSLTVPRVLEDGPRRR